MSIDRLFEQLRHTPPGDFFNPWRDYDPGHDASPDAPEVRREQLRSYLTERLESARWLLVAEALGYQGGHFTGIAMTSERILLGHQRNAYGVCPEDVFRTVQPRRTSQPALKPDGMSEPTATIVWGAIASLNLNPYEIVLWNALPWHPYRADRGLLSNRTPVPAEMAAGEAPLRTFLSLYSGSKVVAVGRKCEELLTHMGVDHHPVRHPANGGAPKFRKQFSHLAADIGPNRLG